MLLPSDPLQPARLCGCRIIARNKLPSLWNPCHFPAKIPLWIEFHWTVLGPSKKYIQDLPAILEGRRPWIQYPSISGQYSYAYDEEIRNAISLFHGCVWMRVEWETSSMGYTEVQGAPNIAAEYNGQVGEGGCCLDGSLDILSHKKQRTYLVWQAWANIWHFKGN